MNINYFLSAYPALTQNMVARVYEASSPLAEVANFVVVETDADGTPNPGGGHNAMASVSFNGLDAVTHIVRLFTLSGTLLHEYDVQPTVDTVTLFDPIHFKIGDGGTYTPAAGQPVLTNPAFDGLNAEDVLIFQEGFRFLSPGIEYTMTAPVLTLINGTDFETGQGWTVIKKPLAVTTPVNDSVVGKGFGGFIDVVSNIDYAASHLRKVIRFSGTGNYTFPVGASLPIGYNHVFNNFGTEGSLPQINFSNGLLLYGATPKSSLVVPFGSTVWLTWDGTNWNCTMVQINGATAGPVAGDVIGFGSVPMGDIPSGDTYFTITHGLAIPGAYRVFPALRGTSATKAADNICGFAVFDLLNNSFKVTITEQYNGVQNLTFDYLIVKF